MLDDVRAEGLIGFLTKSLCMRVSVFNETTIR